jgi:ferritin-like metal-binding protein YciE
MATELHEQLTKYLTDAHSIEVQALAQLREAPKLARDPELAQAFREHLTQTEQHERITRELLEKRGADPSKLKDIVMAVGGKGFVLFARLQPDTPGKLFAHALSYEALEFAAYECLLRVAERAGEPDVTTRVTGIRDDERAMMERLELNVERAVDAALAAHPRDDVRELVRKYLEDAHAIEQQAIQLLERAPKLVDDEQLASVFADHLAETRDHAELIEERLQALGGNASSLKDAALRLGALGLSTFFQRHPDTPGKLAVFAYAFEHLEIGGYEELKLVAQRAGDQETVALVDTIVAQERNAANTIAGMFGTAVAASLRSVGAAV